MLAIKRWFIRRRQFKTAPARASASWSDAASVEALLGAQGHLLAILAALFERHDVMASDELANALAEFAALTSEEQPDEGLILTLWAAYVRDAAATLRDRPSVQ